VTVPPAGKLTGAVLLMLKRGTVLVATVQLEHDPALLVTVLLIDVTLSLNVPTVTVNDFVSVAPAATVTLCV
jgi:hypothetical protein